MTMPDGAGALGELDGAAALGDPAAGPVAGRHANPTPTSASTAKTAAVVIGSAILGHDRRPPRPGAATSTSFSRSAG
jgi:hypothetical protein